MHLTLQWNDSCESFSAGHHCDQWCDHHCLSQHPLQYSRREEWALFCRFRCWLMGTQKQNWNDFMHPFGHSAEQMQSPRAFPKLLKFLSLPGGFLAQVRTVTYSKLVIYAWILEWTTDKHIWMYLSSSNHWSAPPKHKTIFVALLFVEVSYQIHIIESWE